jgi:hypothetical protein
MFDDLSTFDTETIADRELPPLVRDHDHRQADF